MLVCSTLVSNEDLVYHKTSDLSSILCSSLLWNITLIVSMCYAYGWLFNDDTVNDDFIICEAHEQCGIRASLRRGGAYGMNIIKRVSKQENHLNMETPEVVHFKFFNVFIRYKS